MALIKCEECGKEISGSAERCPHCGHKTSYGVNETKKKVNAVAALVACAFTILGLYLVFANIGELVDVYIRWKGIKYYRDTSFIEYLFEWEEMSLYLKVIIGTVLMGCGIGIGLRLAFPWLSHDRTAESTSEVSIGPDEWRCHCGRVNKNRIITCECGRKKIEKQTMEIRADDWKCTCGRINRDYITTCSCGQSKRNIGVK